MKKFKIISALLLCVALAAAFLACDGKDKDAKGEKTPDGSETDLNAPDPDAPDLPKINMGDKTFTFLVTSWGDFNTLSPDIAPEDLGSDPDPILQLAKERQTHIESTYNIKLKTHNIPSHTDAVSQYQSSILADDGTYDAAITTCTNFTSLLSGNYLTDLQDIPNLNASKPYWNKNFYEAMSVLGRHYALDGDISKRRLECVWIMVFNKALLSSKGLESPFDLVKSGDWTYGKMHDMAKTIADDLNGDGKMNIADDLWGINYTGDTIMGIINGCGVKLAENDKDGIPKMTVNGEVNIMKLAKIYETMKDDSYSIDTAFHPSITVGTYKDVELFMEKRCLFVAAATHTITGHDGYNLREAEIDFGIIPYPKWDSAQKDYLPYTAGNFHPVLTIPTTNRDLENTGIILEAMAYEGMKTIRPEFYESLLKRKTARDVESFEMIDYIFGNLNYDIGVMFDFGPSGKKLCYMFGYNMSHNPKASIVTTIDKNINAWQRAIDQMIAEVDSH